MKAFPYGEAGIYIDLEIDDRPDRAARTHAAVRALRARLPGADVVAGAGVVAVFQVGAFDQLDAIVDEAARAAVAEQPAVDAAPVHLLDVVYDGPDLTEVARLVGGSVDDVIALHTGVIHRVELLGFLPGFAYLGGVHPRLALPRRATPRPSVPAGSVGLAAGFTGVYPSVSPGGWHLLGRALDFQPFHPARGAALRPGDAVRFRAVGPRDNEVLASSEPLPRSSGKALTILRAPACATVQDGGRDGMLGDGLPPSGALDGAALVAANLAVGNPARSAVLEIPQGSLELRAEGELALSVDGAAPEVLRDGATMVVPVGQRAVRYLAASGGVDVPLVLSSRSTLLPARLGGLAGRPLRRGDRVPIGEIRGRTLVTRAPEDPAVVTTLVIDPGPHVALFDDGALEHLLASRYTLSRLGDRVGVRLDGPSIPHAPRRLHLPVPMVRGAIEITPDGMPIVLGPDHPTTGGYPVLAVVRRASQSQLARLRPGAEVRFLLG